jgi:hypothetical protein
MAPAWNKLGEEYADSATVIIADVDCTKAGHLLQVAIQLSHDSLKGAWLQPLSLKRDLLVSNFAFLTSTCCAA